MTIMGPTFGHALVALKAGEKVRRAGWNGKNMHLYLEKFEHALTTYEPCIVMFTAQGKLQPGWRASQADMLAEDWEVVS